MAGIPRRATLRRSRRKTPDFEAQEQARVPHLPKHEQQQPCHHRPRRLHHSFLSLSNSADCIHGAPSRRVERSEGGPTTPRSLLVLLFVGSDWYPPEIASRSIGRTISSSCRAALHLRETTPLFFFASPQPTLVSLRVVRSLAFPYTSATQDDFLSS